ncbi:MAG: 4-hydroxy-tetrahydrodipicolinate reductase [Myxococcota bacterium]
MRTLGVLGATGRMGTLVIDEIVRSDALRLGAAIAHAGSTRIGEDAGQSVGAGPIGVGISSTAEGCFDGCDAVIDFSTPEALAACLPHMRGIPLVSGTTGLGPESLDALMHHSQSAPLLVASNFSTGVAVLLDLVRRAAAALPNYDIEVVEAHHRHKVDAPSGTALSLARAAAIGRQQELSEVALVGRGAADGRRISGQIGLHAIRGGGIIGDHEVMLVGDGERISIGHTAIRRSTFAEGAVRAATWLCGRSPGRYALTDVLGLTAT